MLQPRLTKVEPMPQMKLQLFYETGEVKIFDVAPYATGPWYGQLQDAGYFNAVQMLPGGIGIEWPEGQDIAPQHCSKEISLIFHSEEYELEELQSLSGVLFLLS